MLCAVVESVANPTSGSFMFALSSLLLQKERKCTVQGVETKPKQRHGQKLVELDSMSLALVPDSYKSCSRRPDLSTASLNRHSINLKAKYVSYMATSLEKDSTPLHVVRVLLSLEYLQGCAISPSWTELYIRSRIHGEFKNFRKLRL